MLSSPTIRIGVYVAAAVVLTVAVWALAWGSVEARADRRAAEAASSAERLALYFERQSLSIFRYGDSYLKMVRRDYSRSLDPADARQVMDDVPLDRTIVSHITILDRAGTPIFNSGFALKAGVVADDRDYFVHFRDGPGAGRDDLYVSLPHRGRNSGKVLVRLVRRVVDANGDFAGVIFAALDAASITEFFRAMHLGDRSSATLVGLDKRIRARSTYGPAGPGQDISGSRIWDELARRPAGSYRQTSVVDDVSRHYAYRRLTEFPLVVAIGIALSDISQGLSQYRSAAYFIAGLATVLIATVTALLSREVLASERLRGSEARVRAMRDELEIRVVERTAQLEAVQDELIRKERLAVLGQLTGTVAHELRNPLSTIDTSISVLEKRIDTSRPDVARPIERIHRNVKRCNEIIIELLDFAHVRGVNLEPTVLDDWLRELLSELDAPSMAQITTELDAGDMRVPIDRDRLRRAVINLLGNARDAIADGRREDGTIRVSTRVAGDRAEIVVEDDGPGIAEELLSQIHEPLFSTKSFGVGLGLPIVTQVMAEHGGGFEMENREGAGARARLWLPLGPRARA